MDLPVVLGPDVAERGGDAALGHDGVGLAEERLADDRGAGAELARLDGGTKPGAAGADDDDVEVVAFGLGHQKILGSLKAPDATSQM